MAIINTEDNNSPQRPGKKQYNCIRVLITELKIAFSNNSLEQKIHTCLRTNYVKEHRHIKEYYMVYTLFSLLASVLANRENSIDTIKWIQISRRDQYVL